MGVTSNRGGVVLETNVEGEHEVRSSETIALHDAGTTKEWPLVERLGPVWWRWVVWDQGGSRMGYGLGLEGVDAIEAALGASLHHSDSKLVTGPKEWPERAFGAVVLARGKKGARES